MRWCPTTSRAGQEQEQQVRLQQRTVGGRNEEMCVQWIKTRLEKEMQGGRRRMKYVEG
jgi:hypothetical protein